MNELAAMNRKYDSHNDKRFPNSHSEVTFWRYLMTPHVQLLSHDERYFVAFNVLSVFVLSDAIVQQMNITSFAVFS